MFLLEHFFILNTENLLPVSYHPSINLVRMIRVPGNMDYRRKMVGGGDMGSGGRGGGGRGGGGRERGGEESGLKLFVYVDIMLF